MYIYSSNPIKIQFDSSETTGRGMVGWRQNCDRIDTTSSTIRNTWFLYLACLVVDLCVGDASSSGNSSPVDLLLSTGLVNLESSIVVTLHGFFLSWFLLNLKIKNPLDIQRDRGRQAITKKVEDNLKSKGLHEESSFKNNFLPIRISSHFSKKKQRDWNLKERVVFIFIAPWHVFFFSNERGREGTIICLMMQSQENKSWHPAD